MTEKTSRISPDTQAAAKRLGISFEKLLTLLADGTFTIESDTHHAGIPFEQILRYEAQHGKRPAPAPVPVVAPRPAQAKPPAPLDPVATAAQARHIQTLLFKSGVVIPATEGVRLARIRQGAEKPDNQATIVLLARLYRLEQAEGGREVSMGDAISHISTQHPNTPAILTPPSDPEDEDEGGPEPEPTPASTAQAAQKKIAAESKPTRTGHEYVPGSRPMSPMMRHRLHSGAECFDVQPISNKG